MDKDKLNAYKNAQKEVAETEKSTEEFKPIGVPIAKKENKKPMTIVMTPTNKEKLSKMADSVNMSMSELIAYWIENQ